MSTEKAKSLWGQDFRVVSEGLAETDVVIFVEKLMRQHRESLKQLDHIAALHELATKTVEDAEQMATTIREEAKTQSNADSASMVAEAKKKAGQILEEADKAAKDRTEAARDTIAAVAQESRRHLRQRITEIDEALAALKESAVRELSGRMPSHYIGKHLYQGVHFLPAFENFVKKVDADLAQDEPPFGPFIERDGTSHNGPGDS